MLELLWLLLPVAAASGWFAARRSSNRSREGETYRTSSPSSYIKGLNFLLNEQQDKAIDFFIKMLEIDSETVETHLALGNLFRRRGEVDRAIRIHQNLIARPTLSRDQRAQALLELGQDYMSAGLYDRAENLFAELVELNLFVEQALGNLKVIYQQEKDWEQCLKVAKRLEQVTGRSLRTERAHYYCELSELAAARGDSALAAAYLKKAQICDQYLVRVTLLQGRMEMARSSWKPAIRTLRRVERQDAAYLPEILEPLNRCYREMDQQAEYVDYLRKLLQAHPLPAIALELAACIEAQQGGAQAIEFLIDYLREQPSLEVVERLLRLLASDSERTLQGNAGQLLQGALQSLLEGQPGYQCSQCGFSMKTLHWQCPSCKSWSRVKPVGGFEEERR